MRLSAGEVTVMVAAAIMALACIAYVLRVMRELGDDESSVEISGGMIIALLLIGANGFLDLYLFLYLLLAETGAR